LSSWSSKYAVRIISTPINPARSNHPKLALTARPPQFHVQTLNDLKIDRSTLNESQMTSARAFHALCFEPKSEVLRTFGVRRGRLPRTQHDLLVSIKNKLSKPVKMIDQQRNDFLSNFL
jgi:hypothetical protein